MTRIPLTRPLLPAPARLLPGLRKAFGSGIVTNAGYVRRFEQAVAGHCGVREAVAVSSCTSGLILALRCLGAKGKAVLPSFTFFATAHACLWNGLEPVFADIDPWTWTLSPREAEKANVERSGSRTSPSVLLAVHTFGNPCDVQALERIARRYRLKLVFDSAHGMGALHNGKPLGSYGDAEVFSLSPTKLLCAGEGGVVTTNDRVLARRLRAARDYGNAGDYDPEIVGLNARMSELHALLGLESLKALEQHARRRQALVGLYKEKLSGLPGIAFQKVAPEDRSSYKDITIAIDPVTFGATRDALQKALSRQGIASRRYYDPPVHRIKAYRKWRKGVLPATERLSHTALSLPLFYAMTEQEVIRVVRVIAGASREK